MPHNVAMILSFINDIQDILSLRLVNKLFNKYFIQNTKQISFPKIRYHLDPIIFSIFPYLNEIKHIDDDKKLRIIGEFEDLVIFIKHLNNLNFQLYVKEPSTDISNINALNILTNKIIENKGNCSFKLTIGRGNKITSNFLFDHGSLSWITRFNVMSNAQAINMKLNMVDISMLLYVKRTNLITILFLYSYIHRRPFNIYDTFKHIYSTDVKDLAINIYNRYSGPISYRDEMDICEKIIFDALINLEVLEIDLGFLTKPKLFSRFFEEKRMWWFEDKRDKYPVIEVKYSKPVKYDYLVHIFKFIELISDKQNNNIITDLTPDPEICTNNYIIDLFDTMIGRYNKLSLYPLSVFIKIRILDGYNKGIITRHVGNAVFELQYPF